MYASRSYRNYRHRILSAKPPCSYPGCTEVAMTLDHIVAVSLGGDNSPSNLRPMCRSHNEALGRDLGNQMKRRRQW
jgi:5-methylcytosine-specific restriction endonuclease McrA